MNEDKIVQEKITTFHRLHKGGANRPSYWRGKKIIKMPFDLWIYQEIISEMQPDYLVECGTRFGGSAFYFQDIMDLNNYGGQVITIDINPPEHKDSRIIYLKGKSVDPLIFSTVEKLVKAGSVMVSLDSDHSEANVSQELSLYSKLVSLNHYLVVEDTCLNGHPARKDYGPGPMEALEAFLLINHEFISDRSREVHLFTEHPKGWLRRVR